MKTATFTQCSFLILFLLQTITHSDSKPKGMFLFQTIIQFLLKIKCRRLAFLRYVIFPFLPENCRWEAWGEWETCSKSCGYGSQIRTRSNPSNIVNGEKQRCLGKTKDKRACNKHNCDGSSKYEFSTIFWKIMANIKLCSSRVGISWNRSFLL